MINKENSSSSLQINKKNESSEMLYLLITFDNMQTNVTDK